MRETEYDCNCHENVSDENLSELFEYVEFDVFFELVPVDCRDEQLSYGCRNCSACCSVSRYQCKVEDDVYDDSDDRCCDEYFLEIF